MKSLLFPCLLSIIAGFATFVAVLAVLNYTGGEHFIQPYHYLWGFTHQFAQRIDPAPPSDPAHYGETNEFYGPFGAFFDEYFGIAFWTLLFALAFFLFVFRRKPTDLTRRCS